MSGTVGARCQVGSDAQFFREAVHTYIQQIVIWCTIYISSRLAVHRYRYPANYYLVPVHLQLRRVGTFHDGTVIFYDEVRYRYRTYVLKWEVS